MRRKSRTGSSPVPGTKKYYIYYIISIIKLYIAEWSSPVARWAHNPKVVWFKSHLRNQKNNKDSHSTVLIIFLVATLCTLCEICPSRVLLDLRTRYFLRCVGSYHISFSLYEKIFRCQRQHITGNKLYLFYFTW